MPAGYVFDELIIQSTPGVVLASIARPIGPIERGSFDGADWAPLADPQPVLADGFGITPGGVPYFDTEGPDSGDEAGLWVDPVNDLIWLEAV